MTGKLQRVRMLKVTACQDGLVWYAKMVGEYVPCLGLEHGEWKSRAPSGYTNFIPENNARVAHVFVGEDKLNEYPYKFANVETLGLVKPAKSCATSCDRMGICQALDDCQDQLRIDAAAKNRAAFGALFSKLFTPKARRGWYEIDELQEVKKQRDQLLEASLRLAKRGFFQPSSCADMGTQRDMYAMRNAIAKASEAR